MCDVFPAFENCCMCINIRVGMMFIAVISVITGTTVLCLYVAKSGESFQDSVKDIKETINMTDPVAILKKSGKMVKKGVATMAAVFVLSGLVLLIAVLTDEEALTQVFVWLMFLNVVFGFLLIISTGYTCVTQPQCVLSELDGFTSAVLVVLAAIYLFIWIYFISVVNSYTLLDFGR